MKASKSYEEAIRQLEEIVTKLESGEASLDEAMQLFEKGVALSSFCYKKLENAEQKMIELSKLTEANMEESDE